MNDNKRDSQRTADWSRTCEGCENVQTETFGKGKTVFRCFAPGRWKGYTVSEKSGRFLPYVPAWCPLMLETEGTGKCGKQGN